MRLPEDETLIQGRKGGGAKQHTPVEDPDDLLSTAKLKMLLAIAEGEIQGELTAQNIFLNDTPLANADGSYNFTGVKWDFRPGTQDQDYIQGLPEVDNEMSANVTVTTTAPWTRQFSNLMLDAVRIKLSLPVQYTYKDNGDMVGTVTEYAVDLSTDGAAWQTVVNGKFDGKTTTEYQRDIRIDLPAATTGWAVRVRRITPDSVGNSKLINAFKVFSFAEVIDSKLRYPNTALLYIEVDASQFTSGAPKVTCRPKGKLVHVPDSYDPVTRTYSGTWSGGFKMAYTNNPAWVFYDLVLDEIYGMGTRIDAGMIDKWELYAIAQYCDQKVSNGAGGTEPRFTCNVYIQSQQDAYTVLSDLAAIFRGITFWGNDQIYVRADVPQDEVDFTYHASNVIDGLFTYGGGSYKNRYSSALVSWSDPQNHYSDTVESVYDSDLVKRYRVNQMSMTAIGCTSQSEAHRRGRWALLSNARDGTVSFGVGLDGYIPLPAEIIGIADPFRAGKQNGGRIRAVSGLNVTLDRPADYAAGDRLVVNLPDGKAQTRTIASVSADKQTVTVTTPFRLPPESGAVWAVDSDNLAIQYFRVTSIRANDDSNGGFTITAVQHDPNKYRYIDDGVRITPAPVTVTPVSVLPAPKNITLTETDHIEQGLTVATMNVSWDRVDGAIRCQAQWRKDNGDWINVPVSSAQGFTVQGIYTGSYDVRVRALNAQDSGSPWGYADTTYLTGKTGKPGTPQSLLASDDVVWAIDITWAFPDGSGDTAYTEIQRTTTEDKANPQLLALVPYPATHYQHGPMRAGVSQWYRARLVDRIGNTGDWTAWAAGQSSSNAGDYLDMIGDTLEQTEGYKNLVSDIADLSDDIQSARDDITAVTTESAATKAGLAQEVTDRKKAITDEAAARGQALLTEKNARVADISNVNQTIQTTTESLAQMMAQISAGTGAQFDPLKIWYFDSTVEGWTGNGTPTFVDGWIRPANHATDPWVASPGSLGVNSSSHRFVKMRIRKFGAPGWAGQLRWRGTGGFNDTNMLTVAEPAYDANGIATLEFDNIPWLTETTINQFRLDLSTRQDATNYFLIDWVALGRPTPGAGMAALQAETTARVQGDQAEATARETLATQIRGGYTGDDPSKLASGLLFTERQARITAQEAEVTARTALESTVNANKAAVTQELATLTTEQEAQATTLSGLQTTVGKNTGDITRIDKAVADNNKAQTTALAAVKATTDQNKTDISTETTARAEGDSALGRRIDSLKVDVDGNTASRDAGIVGNVSNALANFMAFSDQRVTFAVGETKTMAEITEAKKTAADATSAVAEQVTTLKATVEQNGQTNAAAITRIDKAVTDLESATAISIEQVTASIGQTNANVQTTSQAVADINGKLSAQWGVKVQVEANGVKRIAGIQLGIDGTGASNFLISADTFAVYNPTTNGQELVFASTGGQMFMRSVFIQDGSIDNGKIGNYIQSSNWDGTGNVGWHINKSGYATFNGVTVRGTIYATDGIFKGRVEATSGSFKGSVEATSFVGDVANTGVYPDASARSDSAVSTSIPMVYMDSSNSGLSKNAIVDSLIYVRGLVGAVVATVQVTIAGNVRTFTYDVPVGGVWFSAKHAVTGLGGQRIEASIVLSSGNATMRITAATMTVTRGTGSFS